MPSLGTVSRSRSATPRVSVLIPAFDAEATILEAVMSALDQTLAEIEVVVVDDGSRVPVAGVLRSVGDDRLRILRTAANRGVSAARNAALEASRAPVIAQLDADDLWLPSHLEGLVPAFEDPQVGLSYANAQVVGHPRSIERWIARPAASGGPHGVIEWQIPPVADLSELLRGNPIPACAVTLRTSAVRAAGGYPEWLSIGEDYVLYLRLLSAGWRFAYTDRATAVYRWPDPARGVTFSRRRVTRQQVKLYAWLALQAPMQAARWQRLVVELAEVLATHFPRSLPALRAAHRMARSATENLLGGGDSSPNGEFADNEDKARP